MHVAHTLTLSLADFCTGGKKIMCSQNTWQPFEKRFLQTQCEPCPERTNTLGQSAATGYDQCVCGDGLYRAPRWHAANAPTEAQFQASEREWLASKNRDACQDPRGIVRTDLPETCCICPVGTNCNVGGIPLTALPLRAGYFRLSEDSSDVRRCPGM